MTGGRRGSVDLEKEEAGWEGEFGVDDTKLVKEAVAKALPYYQWLWEKKLR